MAYNEKFPSPYGDFVFQREFIMLYFNLTEKGFRPLTGILFFNSIIHLGYSRTTETFPSPYGDFVFQPAESEDYYGTTDF